MPVTYKTESGKLTRFGGGTTEVLSPWPQPRGWIKGPKDQVWRHIRPSIRLPSGDIDRLILRQANRVAGPMPDAVIGEQAMGVERRRREDQLNFLYWARHIPSEVRRSISMFPDRQWHLLSMVARCGSAAHDLIKTNPALAYALASSWVFRKSPVSQPMRSTRALLRRGQKQREILAWLEFPDSEAVRRVLSRIVPQSCTIPRLLYLRDACRDRQVVKTLCHLRRINAAVLRIVTDPELRERIGFDILQRLSEKRKQDRTPRCAWMLKDVDRMCAALDIRPPRILTLDDIERIHDEMLEDMAEEEGLADSSLEDVEFPAPPVPGNGKIIPITDAAMLREEGIVQKHCVWAYGRAVAIEKHTFIYRVLEPERATLELVRSRSGWKVGQLKGFLNGNVSRETYLAVVNWLEAAKRPRQQSARSTVPARQGGQVVQAELWPCDCQPREV